jgi:hypothetical protein
MPPRARSPFTRSLSSSCLAAVLGLPDTHSLDTLELESLDEREVPPAGAPSSSPSPGRPLRVEGAPLVAGLCERADWHEPMQPWLDALEPDTRRRLAAAWAEDARHEHASIAAFAQHALELLALAAPASLIVEVHAAMRDEIEHARRCFGLASVYAERPIGPSELELAALTRRAPLDPRDPGSAITVALELFEGGCLNETFAALEAARAAELAEDPVVIDLLVQIADDEARHAALAWRTLAWLVERFPACVPALRERAGKLDDALELSLPSSASERELERHGRLGTRERELVRRQALATIVRPTLRVLTRRAAARSHALECGESIALAL